MRCTWKVAARSNVIYTDRHEIQFSNKDPKGIVTWSEEVIAAWDEYFKSLAIEQKDSITARQRRDTDRAMRYDSWGYVRFQAKAR